MRVLVIEDNIRVAESLQDALHATYIVDIENSGKAALDNMDLAGYDIILLDLGLPDMSGDEVCRQLRARDVIAPVIIITGNDAISSKVDMLDSGADDYMTKPFNMDELKARMRAVMRRNDDMQNAVIRVGSLELNPAGRTVSRGSKTIELRRKEFDLLEYLMRNNGRTLTSSMIIQHIWQSGDELWTNAVDVHIKYLRDKVDRPFKSQLIKTVHGVGYKLEAAVAKEAVVNT